MAADIHSTSQPPATSGSHDKGLSEALRSEIEKLIWKTIEDKVIVEIGNLKSVLYGQQKESLLHGSDAAQPSSQKDETTHKSLGPQIIHERTLSVSALGQNSTEEYLGMKEMPDNRQQPSILERLEYVEAITRKNGNNGLHTSQCCY